MPAKSKGQKVTRVSKVSQVSKAKKPAASPRSAKQVTSTKVKSVKSDKSLPSSVVTAKATATRAVLSADVYDLVGKKQGTVSLPKEIFGTKVNKKLLSQALHIYFVNRSQHAGSAKTRAEVRGGGAKPWRQKGTGRARAGSRRSPVWVGGGKALGPKHRNIQLTLPKKMKRAALLSALSTKANAHEIKIITGFEKMPAKTKIITNLFKKLETKGSSLIIISQESKGSSQNVKLAVRNIPQASINLASNLNAYDTIKNQNIYISREALNTLPDLLSGSRKTQGANT